MAYCVRAGVWLRNFVLPACTCFLLAGRAIRAAIRLRWRLLLRPQTL